jgi:formate hydrogenlyase subunit 3/multisubunit Na+/H+ antiporter MnhD subunit
MLLVGLRLPSQVTVSAWSPQSLFPNGLNLMADRITWLFSLAVLAAALAVFLTGLSRAGGPRVGPRTATLIVTAAALAAIQAENLIALAITWAVLDLTTFITLILLAQGEDLETQAVLGLGFNAAAALLAVAAALDTLHSGQTIFLVGASPLTERGAVLLVLAAVFRLGVFPFHLGLPMEANIRQGIGTLLRLAPAAVALNLLTHIAAFTPETPLKFWLSLAAAVGLLVGAALWRDAADPRQGISFAVLAHSSLAVLAALWGGASAAAGVLGFGLALVLGGAVMFLHNGYNETDRSWVAASLLGALTLAGLPLTVGYVGVSVLYGGLAASGSWALMAVCIVGQLLVCASTIRLAFWPGDALPKGEPVMGLSYLFGLILPLAVAILAGLGAAFAGTLGGLPAPTLFSLDATQSVPVGAVAVTVLGGFGLWQFEDRVRARAASVWNAATSVARLDWLYVVFWEVYRFIGRTLRTAAGIVEGEGGVLWTIVAALLVWLLFRGK